MLSILFAAAVIVTHLLGVLYSLRREGRAATIRTVWQSVFASRSVWREIRSDGFEFRQRPDVFFFLVSRLLVTMLFVIAAILVVRENLQSM